MDCIEGIHRCRDLEAFPRHVLKELRKIIDCNLAGYNEVDLPGNRIIVLFDPPRPELGPTALEPFATLMHEHPVITYFDKSGDGQALKISDFMTEDEYHERAIYRDFYRQIGAEDQLSFAVQISPGFMIGIAFNRGVRSFTEKDRLRLNLLRPHIVQAYTLRSFPVMRSGRPTSRRFCAKVVWESLLRTTVARSCTPRRAHSSVLPTICRFQHAGSRFFQPVSWNGCARVASMPFPRRWC